MFRGYWLPAIAAGLIVCISNSQSQPTHNRPHAAVEHQTEPNTSYYVPNPLLPPIVVAPIKVQPYQFQPAADDQPQQHGDEIKWTDKAIVFLTLVLAGCGIAGAIIAYRQWYALKEQVAKLDETIAAETQSGKDRAAENAAALAAARTANKIAIGTGRAQTRAYLSIDQAWLEPWVFNVTASLQISNAGKSPARWVEIDATAQVIEDINLKSHEVPLVTTGKCKQRWPVDPGLSGREYTFDPDCGDNTTLKDIFYKAFQKKSLVLQGTLKWETVFGEIFESTFFYWTVPGPQPTGKSEDGNIKLLPIIMSCPSSVDTVRYRQIPTGRKAEDRPA